MHEYGGDILHALKQSRGHWGVSGLSPPKLKRDARNISGVLVNFIMSTPPHKRKAPAKLQRTPI